MIKYENIEFLYLLFGTPIIIACILMYKKWQKKSIEKFGDPLLVQKLIPSRSKNKIYVKNILTVVIFILFSIGLSNPQVGVKMEEVKRKGVDLIIAIDLSKSMMVEDIKPNRLEAAKHAISKLIDRLEGDRVGLIVFAEEAYVQLPITTDYSAAKLFLSTINTEIVATQGTNIGNAIDLSVKSFDLENRQEKAIIIITDGETHDEKAITAAENASESGIFIHTLGMGLNKGGLIPKYNDNGIKIKILGNSSTVIGPQSLNGAEVMATDLRASVSLVLAGLIAKDRTVINRVYHLDRGYEELEKKLRKCKANISRIHY